jgi:multimeric flavodoxin WrbA
MDIVLLDGCAASHPVSQQLRQLAEAGGHSVSHFALGGMILAPCTGDFECWTRTPGVCRTRDEAQEILRAVRAAGLVVFLSPVVFGGYSADLKKAVDRLLGLIHPFFNERDGLTRHQPRYPDYPPMLFLGISDRADAEMLATFREYAGGNAINLLASRYVCHIVAPQADDWREGLANALDRVLADDAGDAFPKPAAGAITQVCRADPGLPAEVPATAAILIGSARPKGSSTSESLARGLAEALEQAGTRCSLVHVQAFIKPGAAAERALATMLAADLLVVSAPLYVDGLPYLATRALERLGRQLGAAAGGPRRLVGILNCGYPEAVHNRSALRQLRHFAGQHGLAWAGGLALGGGEMIHGQPLDDHALLLRRPIRALRLAGAALGAGLPVPEAAIALIARQLVPAGLFRRLAAIRWIKQAHDNHLPRKALDLRPHPGQP